MFRLSIVLSFYFFTYNVNAADIVTSVRSAMQDKYSDQTYLPAGYPKNHEEFSKELNALWKATSGESKLDDYRQPWKKVEIKELEKIVGEIPQKFLLIYPVRKLVKANDLYMKSVIDHYAVDERMVLGGALFKWGCDNSVIPVINVGKWPSKDLREWGPIGISFSRDLNLPSIVDIDKSLIPKKVYSTITGKLKGASLLWKESGIKILFLERDLDSLGNSTAYQLFIKNNNSKKINTIWQEGVFDVSC